MLQRPLVAGKYIPALMGSRYGEYKISISENLCRKHLCGICSQPLGTHSYCILRREYMAEVGVCLEPPAHLDCLCWSLQEELLPPHKFDNQEEAKTDSKWATLGWVSRAMLVRLHKPRSVVTEGKNHKSKPLRGFTGRISMALPVPFEANAVEGLYYVALDRSKNVEKTGFDESSVEHRKEAYRQSRESFEKLGAEAQLRIKMPTPEQFGLVA